MSPGPTATDMFEGITKYAKEVNTVASFKILDAEDVANAVIAALATPPNVLVSTILICVVYVYTGGFQQVETSPAQG